MGFVFSADSGRFLVLVGDVFFFSFFSSSFFFFFFFFFFLGGGGCVWVILSLFVCLFVFRFIIFIFINLKKQTKNKLKHNNRKMGVGHILAV